MDSNYQPPHLLLPRKLGKMAHEAAPGNHFHNEAVFYLNEIKGWPPSIQPDTDLVTQNLWFDDVGTPTTKATTVDLVGEGLTNNYYEIALKCITDAASEGWKQTFPYSGEPRVKSGRRVSALLDIWSVSGVAVTASFINSDGTETRSQTVTSAEWSRVEIKNHLLSGTSCELQVTAGAAGTFYAVPLGMSISPAGLALPPRPSHYVHCEFVDVVTLDAAADPNTWTDVDITAQTNALAHTADIACVIFEATSTYDLWLRRNGSSGGYVVCTVIGGVSQTSRNNVRVLLDDSQVFEYKLDRTAGASALDFGRISVVGFEEWA